MGVNAPFCQRKFPHKESSLQPILAITAGVIFRSTALCHLHSETYFLRLPIPFKINI